MADEPQKPGGLFMVNTKDGETTLYKDGKPVRRYAHPTPKKPKRARLPRPHNPTTFAGPKLKVERAKRHIGDLKAAIEAFHKTSPYEPVSNIDTQTGERVYLLRVKGLVPLEWSGIIGDAVHNLRAALDCLVCDLIRAGGKDQGLNGKFPVKDRAKRLKAGTVPKIKGVSPASERLILRVIARDGWNEPMRLLHWLDLIDKHNRIVAVAAATAQIDALVGIPFMFVGPDGNIRIGGPGPDGRPFMQHAGTPSQFRRIILSDQDVEIHRAPAGFNENVKVSIHIAFAEVKIGESEPVIETLEQLADLVERTIGVFERYAK